MADYRELTVWQKSISLVSEIYALTRNFPNDERFGLVAQMRRCSVSIPSNIAEGSRRKGADLKHFLRIAYGSGAELETQLEISKQLQFTDEVHTKTTEELLEEVMKMLNVMINRST